jgi:hypothetical protein
MRHNGSVDGNWVTTTAERRTGPHGLAVRSASLGRKTDKEKSDPGCRHEVHETNSSARTSRAEKSKLTVDRAGAFTKNKIKALLLAAINLRG